MVDPMFNALALGVTTLAVYDVVRRLRLQKELRGLEKRQEELARRDDELQAIGRLVGEFTEKTLRSPSTPPYLKSELGEIQKLQRRVFRLQREGVAVDHPLVVSSIDEWETRLLKLESLRKRLEHEIEQEGSNA